MSASPTENSEGRFIVEDDSAASSEEGSSSGVARIAETSVGAGDDVEALMTARSQSSSVWGILLSDVDWIVKSVSEVDGMQTVLSVMKLAR
jgi:hypothetical protein